MDSRVWMASLLMLSLVTAAFDVNDLTEAHSEFALKLYRHVTSSAPGDNLFFSPFSISSALAMVHAGAKGNTRSQMEDVLSIADGGDDDHLNDAYSELLELFNDPTNNYTLEVANRLFVHRDFRLLQEYLETTRRYFHASAESLDYGGDPEGSRIHVNNWIANHTEHKIKDLLPQGSVTGLTALVLVNAVYFKAAWRVPFKEEDTVVRSFHGSRHHEEKMHMMVMDDKLFPHLAVPDWNARILEVPYAGSQVSLYIILPDAIDGLSRLESKLTTDGLEGIIDTMTFCNVKVVIPKFKMEQRINLREILIPLGMRDLFDAKQSDLSGVSGSRNLVVSEAVHKAYVEVNEEGTEAAGSTGLGMIISSYPLPLEPFVADRPFVFFIREKESGSILFLGRMVSTPGGSGAVGASSRASGIEGRVNSLSRTPLLLMCAILILQAMLF